MDLTALQTDLLDRIRLAVETTHNHRVVYCTEWLGELPFGLVHWVEVDGEEISTTFPSDWQRSDLDVLDKAGLLTKVGEWQNPGDEFDTAITYEVTSAQSGAASGDHGRLLK
jgi:hypothetical protein